MARLGYRGSLKEDQGSHETKQGAHIIPRFLGILEVHLKRIKGPETLDPGRFQEVSCGVARV